jgi:HK97 family phage major capsid protein
VAESGTTTATDETITEVVLSSFRASTKLIASEELFVDSEVDLDRFLAVELGQRIGALEGAAFATGDGSGKPTGAVSAASTFSVSTAPTGNVTEATIGGVPTQAEYRTSARASRDGSEGPATFHAWLASIEEHSREIDRMLELLEG